MVFLCPEGGGFHDPGALFAQQHQKHPHKREEKFVISFIIFPNTLFWGQNDFKYDYDERYPDESDVRLIIYMS